MVTGRALYSFVREESGISLVEGLIALPFVMLVFAGAVEFSYAMFQWNQTVKAMQLGARYVAVRDPFVSLSGINPTPTASEVGTATPNDGASVTCTSAGDATCVAALTKLVDGSGNWPGLNTFNPRIGLENVVVTYQRSGLGYKGRPDGPVVTVRLALSTEAGKRVTFELPLVGRLMCYFSNENPCAVLDSISIPAMPVTVTSEDLKTNSGA